jgi:hypothetical protein
MNMNMNDVERSLGSIEGSTGITTPGVLRDIAFLFLTTWFPSSKDPNRIWYTGHVYGDVAYDMVSYIRAHYPRIKTKISNGFFGYTVTVELPDELTDNSAEAKARADAYTKAVKLENEELAKELARAKARSRAWAKAKSKAQAKAQAKVRGEITDKAEDLTEDSAEARTKARTRVPAKTRLKKI